MKPKWLEWATRLQSIALGRSDLSTGRTTREQIKMCFEARKQKPFEPIFD